MYIVKRPFRNFGRVMTVGSVISEPAEIKRFKGRLAEGKIICVKDADYSKAASYFKKKYGVDIKTEKSEAVKTVAPADNSTTVKPAAKKVVKKATPVAKVTTGQ